MDRNRKKGQAILAQARAYYNALDGFRRERERNKRYNYGDQWGDIIEVDGRHITEEQYIKEQGNIPLKNNLIRRLVRNVIGVYNSQSEEPRCTARDNNDRATAETMTTVLRYNNHINRMSALYTRTMEEFLISGMAIHKKTYGLRQGRYDCWTDYVQPNNFFFDSRMHDFRGWDCCCVGEIHHITLGEALSRLAHSEADYELMTRIYGTDHDAECEVTEVWRLESVQSYRCHDRKSATVYDTPLSGKNAIDRENRQRQRRGEPLIQCKWLTTERWRYYFIAPTGDILAQGDSPYAHGSHPYVMKMYPMIDGEIHSFVADIVDQQRYTNRLITLYDWIMRASSKGVLLVPEDCIPHGCSPDDFADAWSRYNGVIFYKPSVQGNIPQQVSNNSTNIGIKELLDVQMKMFEDISGVNNALQGKTGNVAISAELYGQQTQNATTTLLDILDTFGEFVRDGMYKDMKNIQQYYSTERIRQIAGADADIDRIADVEMEISMMPRSGTQSQKQSTNAILMEIWRAGQISLEQMLKAGHFDFADAL